MHPLNQFQMKSRFEVDLLELTGNLFVVLCFVFLQFEHRNNCNRSLLGSVELQVVTVKHVLAQLFVPAR